MEGVVLEVTFAFVSLVSEQKEKTMENRVE